MDHQGRCILGGQVGLIMPRIQACMLEVNHVLPQFIACLNKGKGVRPNLTKLLTSDMPAGRGRKGNQAPRKRKTSASVTNAVEVLPTLPGVSSSATASIQLPITHSGTSATPWSFLSHLISHLRLACLYRRPCRTSLLRPILGM